MPLVQLQGHSNKSPLTGERNLIEVPVDEMVDILAETLGPTGAAHLARALMGRLGIEELSPTNIVRAYCQLAAPRRGNEEANHTHPEGV